MSKKIFPILFFVLVFVLISFSFASAGNLPKFWSKINGKIISTDNPLIENSGDPCSDSDGGINYYEKGIVTYLDNGSEEWLEFTDYCQRYVVGDYLFEGYCNKSNGGIFEIIPVLTPSEHICLDGKFIVPSGQYIGCQETDLYPNTRLGGNDPSKSGRTTYWTNPQYKQLAKDFCTGTNNLETPPQEGGDYLIEYYCIDYGDGTFDLGQEIYECNCQSYGSYGANCSGGENQNPLQYGESTREKRGFFEIFRARERTVYEHSFSGKKEIKECIGENCNLQRIQEKAVFRNKIRNFFSFKPNCAKSGEGCLMTECCSGLTCYGSSENYPTCQKSNDFANENYLEN